MGGAGRGLALWLRGVAGPLGWDRLGGAVFGGRGAADRTWGRAAGQGPKTIFARLQECLVADSLTRRDVVASRAIQERDVPLVVVSSGEEIRQDGEWEGKQRDLTRLTERLEAWDVVDKAPHQVWKAEEGRERIERWLRKLVRLQR